MARRYALLYGRERLGPKLALRKRRMAYHLPWECAELYTHPPYWSTGAQTGCKIIFAEWTAKWQTWPATPCRFERV